MTRFARLVELRKIREETDGQVYARILARIESFRQEIGELDKETAQGHEMACELVAQGNTPGPYRFDDFFRGQKWRVQKLKEKIHLAQQEASAAKKVWLAARTKLQQAEKMAIKEEAQRKEEVRRSENKEMDMIGIVQNRFRQ